MFARISFVLVGLSVVLLGSYCENLLAQKAPSTEAAKSKSSTVKAVDRNVESRGPGSQRHGEDSDQEYRIRLKREPDVFFAIRLRLPSQTPS